MTRKKIDLKYITNDSKRKATLNKRKSGLKKKLEEISTLCGVDTCAIIYTPNSPNPEVWPSPLGVTRVLSKFQEMPEFDKTKKMVNQETYLRQRIMKVESEVRKQKYENRKKEVNHLMFQLLGHKENVENLTMLDLTDLSWLIDQKLRDVDFQINRINDQALEDINAHHQVMENNIEFINDGGIGMPFRDPAPEDCYRPTPLKP